MNRNGGVSRDPRNPLGYPGGNLPLLGQAKPQRWRCANGHEYTGDAPSMTLPANPLAPSSLALVSGVCIICVLEAMKAAYPVAEVTDVLEAMKAAYPVVEVTGATTDHVDSPPKE